MINRGSFGKVEKVLALREDGGVSYCTVPEDMRGRGRCNHIAHQSPGESNEEFINRINRDFKEKIKSTGLFAGDEEDRYDGEYEFKPYKMTEEEQANLMEIKGRKDLADKDCQGGYIHLDEPLWNDMDKAYYANKLGVPKGYINSVIARERHVITFLSSIPETKPYYIGQIVTDAKKKQLENKLGSNNIQFDTGIIALNETARANGFEATTDIYVLPYYMREDPKVGEAKPDVSLGDDESSTEAGDKFNKLSDARLKAEQDSSETGSVKNPLNELYNTVIIKRKDPEAQQLAYERLLNNKGLDDKKQIKRRGFALKSLADEFSGKHGIMRGYLTGRAQVYTARGVITPSSDLEVNEIGLPPKMVANIFRPSIVDRLSQDGWDAEEQMWFMRECNKFDQTKVDPECVDILSRIANEQELKCIANRQPSLYGSSLLSFNVKVSKYDNKNSSSGVGDTLGTVQLNPIYAAGYAADHDGDQMTITGINTAQLNENLKEIDGVSRRATRRPNAEKTTLNYASKEARWGLMNILEKRSK